MEIRNRKSSGVFETSTAKFEKMTRSDEISLPDLPGVLKVAQNRMNHENLRAFFKLVDFVSKNMKFKLFRKFMVIYYLFK